MSSNIYRSISKLPLSLFIDAVVDGNLQGLVISGAPTEEELNKAWSEIGVQYADAMKDTHYIRIISLYREITMLEITQKQRHLLIEALKKYYCKQFANELNKLLASSFKFDVEKPEEYDHELKRAYNRTKGFKIEIDLKKGQLEALESAQGSGKYTREYFGSIMLDLSDDAGRDLSEDLITVYAFCVRMNRLKQKCETQKNRQNGKRGKN